MKSPKSDVKKDVTKQPIRKDNSFPIVAIGASAGGLEAMSLLLKNLPADTGMAFIYVQHLSPDHESLLTTIFSKISKMNVQEIENMEHIAPNNVYVIPPNKEIEVVDGHIHMFPRPKDFIPNFSIDLLFKSLAETHKENVIGVILSGYASDGVIGLKAIKEAGGKTFAQDKSAKAKSMPTLAIASGVVDYILSPKGIAKELVRMSKESSIHNVAPEIKQHKEPEIKLQIEPQLENDSDFLNAIFELLLKETGVDFSHYKMPTIKRRLNHKMRQSGLNSKSEYLKLLLEKDNEIELLYTDLIINVTSFFREPDTFDYLKTTLLSKLVESKSTDEILRIWVPACSTGQEAYSLAMMLVELQDNKTNKIQVQIFATDLSDRAIREARAGEYSLDDVKSIPEKYLKRFFQKNGDAYRVIKELRDICVFAPHNILSDPPFSRMDFVSCCNMLIYFDIAAQKKVFSTLHFALKDGGFLMLGKAESIGASSQLFNRINNEYKIYSKKKTIGKTKIFDLKPRFTRPIMPNNKIANSSKAISVNPIGIESAIDSILLSNYIPACVIVNKDMEIIQFRGDVSSFLEHPSGKASLNVLKMAKPEFAFELRNAIDKAVKTKQTVLKLGIELTIDSEMQFISLEVSPLKIDWDEPLLLVVFKIQEQVEKIIENDSSGKNRSSQKDVKIKNLTEELNSIRNEMISTAESQEIIHEELQAANEEIVSSNEELQSLNEELETSKEEIEATNDELISTNLELQLRNELLTESQEYSDAIFATIHEPMLILDDTLKIKSANKSFYKTFNVEKLDVEGKLFFALDNKRWEIPELREKLKEIISQNNSFENFEVTQIVSDDNQKIMLLNARLIVQKVKKEKLILLAIEDITERSKYYLKERYALSLIEASLDPLITINAGGKITDMNEATVDLTGVSREKMKGTDFYTYFTEPLKASEVHKEVFDKGHVTNYPLTLRHHNGKITDVLFNGSVYKDVKGNVQGVVIIARDVTEQKRIAAELLESKLISEMAGNNAVVAKFKAEDAVKSKQQFLSNMSHEIRTPMNAIVGFTNILLKTDLTTKQKEFLSAIKISGDTLTSLINDILDLAKVDAGKMTFEHIPFKIIPNISDTLKLFEIKILEKQLKLVQVYDEKIPEILVGDPNRLNQIIMNLMSNAVKFTLKGKITLAIKLLSENSKSVTLQISVSDTGIGIEKNMIDVVFNDFQQAYSGTSRLYGGTGLGLSIVKQLVTAQGGEISVQSEINKGSVFSLILTFSKKKAGRVNKKTV